MFAVTAVLSDITSNVPTVMLLLPFAGQDPLAGPLMALASGLASNLIIIGSLANIIVVDAAAAKGLKIRCSLRSSPCADQLQRAAAVANTNIRVK